MDNNTFMNLYTLYKGKKVFITGHTGFKGSWLVRYLQILGADVKGYAFAANTLSHYNYIEDSINIESVIGDILDYKNLESELLSFQPDIIFHLAAQPLVIDSYQNPVYTYEVNAMGTANLLEATRRMEGKCSIIIITTDKVYHNYEWLYPYRENDRLGGYDPYSASKACAEIITNSFRSGFFGNNDYEVHQKRVATVRAGNVIGGGDFAANRLIPDIVNAFIAKTPVLIRYPSAVRPWQHVLDALNGYLLLGCYMHANPENNQWGSSWNFGPAVDENITVEQLVQWSVTSWGSGEYLVEENESKFHEAGLLRLDCSKALNLLSWKPRWSAMEAVENSVEWYKRVLVNKENAINVTTRQIEKYMNS